MSKKIDFRQSIESLKPNEPYPAKKPKPEESLSFQPQGAGIKMISAQVEPRSSCTGSDHKSKNPKKQKEDKNLSEIIGFQVERFFPDGKEITFSEKDGIFQIPHWLFEFCHKATQTRNELIIFQCLIRYTLGFRRSKVEASQTFIGQWTGLSESTVRRSMKGLLASGLVKQVAVGQACHEWGAYEVPIVKAYLSVKEKAELTLNSAQVELRLDRTENSVQDAGGTPLNLYSKKEIINKTENKTLSLFPEKIRIFYEKSAFGKRESEIRNFLELKKQFPAEEIFECWNFVHENGCVTTKQTVYSPMGYLASAYQQVLALVQKAALAKRRVEAERLVEIKKRADREKSEKEEAEMLLQAEKAFFQAFPDPAEQVKYLNQKVKNQFNGFPLPREYLIKDWFASGDHGNRK